LGGAVAAFAGDEFEEAFAFADNQGLDDALFADRIGEFLEGVRGKFLAGLQGGGPDAVQGDALHAVA
jgi:hypothetical protein